MTFEELTNERLTRLSERVYALERAAEIAKNPATVNLAALEKNLEEWVNFFCDRSGDHSMRALWKDYLRLQHQKDNR